MRKTLLTLLCLMVCVALVASVSLARNVEKNVTYRPMKQFNGPTTGLNGQRLNATAVAGTTFLGTWTFDSGGSCVTEGWTTVDLTEQIGDFWHVDDFAGLGGGDFGGLHATEGNKSMWCGARPSASLDLCGYVTLPGYGNGWDQIFQSNCFNGLTGDVNVSYVASWDSEPGYDFTHVEYDLCDDNWTALADYDGAVLDSVAGVAIADSLHAGSVRIRFHFVADGGWSDSDGAFNTDGAFILDDLTIADGGGTVNYENFESESVGDNGTLDGVWNTANNPGYGDLASLYQGLGILQEDLCYTEYTCLWGFFNGSTADYTCGGFPGVTAVPYENVRGQYLTNEVWSPIIPWIGSGTTAELTFRVYRDLPLDNLIFYIWHVRSFVAGCPGGWFDDNTVYFGDNKDWLPDRFSFGDKVAAGASDIQIALGCWDMCPFWCGAVGSGGCHSQAPLIDNVQVYRVATQGPQWELRGWNRFQDNFATDGTTTGTVRIDTANDLLPAANPNIHPGDSLAVLVQDPASGVATDPYTATGPAIYGYFAVFPQGQASKSGNAISADVSRWPVVDSATDPVGNTWYIVRMDTSYTSNGSVVANGFCVDLNDNLFTPGDTIEYFLMAQSADGPGSKTYFHGGYSWLDNFDAVNAVVTTTDINVAYANPMEVTCLPTVQLKGGDILYVDDGDGRFVQPYFDSAFDQLGILDKVDRYDVRSPASNVGNGPGARVRDVFQQLIPIYKKIIWNSEDLNNGTIGDGVGGAGEKSDDFSMLYTFVDQSDNNPGLYISGNNVASEWSTLAATAAIDLKNVYMNFNLVSLDHRAVGHAVNPLGIGVNSGIFDHVTGPDTLITYGGCPAISQLDVLSPGGGASSVEMTYDGDVNHAAILSQTTLNSAGAQAHVVLSGFSFDQIRDDRAGANGGVLDRVHHLYDVLVYLENTPSVPTAAKPTPFVNSLSQNYPNPFNPQTSIEFTVKNRAPVVLKVYNVAGQLVRTLVNDTREPGIVHAITWDGRNDAGQSVSSGVYFYKLVTTGFTQTKKMVLLK